MRNIYKFNHTKFANDVIRCIEYYGWDELITRAHTTEKVMLRAIKWRTGTISVQTMAKFCNAMDRSPLVYFDNKVSDEKEEDLKFF